MTAPLDLDAIKARVDAATPGPWWAWDRGVGWHIAIGEPTEGTWGGPARLLPASERTDIGREADAEFIAAARQDVPALIAEVERLRALVEPVTAPGGPADGDRVWLIETPAALMHRFPRPDCCQWPPPQDGVIVLAAEAVEGWQAKPCPRCWPGAS